MVPSPRPRLAMSLLPPLSPLKHTNGDSRRSHIVTPAGGIASPFFLPLRVMAPPRLVGCRADVPTGCLRCLDSGLGGPTSAVGPESVLVWQHVPDVNVWTVGQATARRRRGRVRTSDDARWPIADQKNG